MDDLELHRTSRIPNDQLAGKYLTFALGCEEYGLEILKVREIIGYMDITAVPKAPVYVKGIINLRGKVIRIVDLRSMFDMQPSDVTDQTCIIVVDFIHEQQRVQTGIVVDRVSEVLDVTADQIEEPPHYDDRHQSDFILGIGKIGKSVKILLDIDRVLSNETLLEPAITS